MSEGSFQMWLKLQQINNQLGSAPKLPQPVIGGLGLDSRQRDECQRRDMLLLQVVNAVLAGLVIVYYH